MRLIYGLIYYYLLAVVVFFFGLVVFVPRFTRRIFFTLTDKYPGASKIVNYVVMGAMIINGIVLLDSISTYYAYNSMMGDERTIALESGNINYMDVYKRSKEFYMAERNFMLTFSALFVTFAYHRFMVALRKLHHIENDIESEAKKTVKN